MHPVDVPVSFGYGLMPTDPEAIKIYKKLGLKGHNGDDYAVYRVQTRAIVRGVVVVAGAVNDGGGNSVRIRFTWRDGREYICQHDHLSMVLVESGQEVSPGDVVGITGNTGAAAGYHLHFSVRPVSGYDPKDGYYGYINPQPFYEEDTTVTPIENFQNCFITQAQRFANEDEVEQWQESGMEAYTWVQRNAPNPVLWETDFANCWITLFGYFPSQEQKAKYQQSVYFPLQPYTFVQEAYRQEHPSTGVPNVDAAIKHLADAQADLERAQDALGGD